MGCHQTPFLCEIVPIFLFNRILELENEILTRDEEQSDWINSKAELLASKQDAEQKVVELKAEVIENFYNYSMT